MSRMSCFGSRISHTVRSLYFVYFTLHSQAVIQPQEDAALAFLKARGTARSPPRGSGGDEQSMHGQVMNSPAKQFARFGTGAEGDTNTPPKKDVKYKSLRFKTLKQRQKLKQIDFAASTDPNTAADSSASPVFVVSSPSRSRKAVPDGWFGSLRRKKGGDQGDVVNCCASVAPGLSRCAVCGNSW